MEKNRISVCSKPYCKTTFEVRQGDIKILDDGRVILPEFCYRCEAQNDFVSWESKTYEGDRWDGTPHQFSYKIKKYF